MTVARDAPPTLPAGVLQHDLWARLAEEGTLRAPASQTRALRLTGTLDTERLLEAIREVVAAVDILAVTVRPRDGRPVMIPGACPPQVRVRDASGSSPAQRVAEAERLLRAERDRAIDPSEGPLVRFDVVHLGGGDAVLAATGHALACDLHSLYALLGAVMTAYFGRFRPADLPPFAQGAHALPRQDPAALRPRQRWWRARLASREPAPAAGTGAGGAAPGPGAPGGGERRCTARAHIDAGCWQGLTPLVRPVGGNSWLAVLALAAHWWQRTTGRLPPLGCMLDVRQLVGAGEVVGPLSDRIVFFPDLATDPPRTFGQLLLATHAGLLDAVVHHLPYGELRAVARDVAPGAGALGGQLFAHYCPVPRSSGTTRGEETLARRGMSIELFADAALAGRGQGHGGWEGVEWDLAIAEEGGGMALTLDYPEGGDARLDGLPGWVASALGAVVADPQRPLPSP